MPYMTIQTSPVGPTVLLDVGLSAPRRAVMAAMNQIIPPPIVITALIDTGADSTVIDQAVIARLGTPPIGTMSIVTPSTGAVPAVCRLFDLYIAVPSLESGKSLVAFNAMAVIESDFSMHGGAYQALLGRDILNYGFFLYNGADKQYILGF